MLGWPHSYSGRLFYGCALSWALQDVNDVRPLAVVSLVIKPDAAETLFVLFILFRRFEGQAAPCLRHVDIFTSDANELPGYLSPYLHVLLHGGFTGIERRTTVTNETEATRTWFNLTNMLKGTWTWLNGGFIFVLWCWFHQK